MKQQILDTIKAYDTIIIHRHVRPDPDAIGSQCGLKEMLKQTFPEKTIYAAGEEDPALTFLARMDIVGDHVYRGALVIVCDTANTERVCDQRYRHGDKIIKIDHHPNHDPYGDQMWVDTNASSTSELIFEFYLTFQDSLAMNETIARLIYAGIVGDTGRFLFPSTSNKTFQYAAKLIEYPFDRTSLYDGMYNVNRNIAKLKGYILEHHTLSPNGLSTVTLTKQILDKYKVSSLILDVWLARLAILKGLKFGYSLLKSRIRSGFGSVPKDL